MNRCRLVANVDISVAQNVLNQVKSSIQQMLIWLVQQWQGRICSKFYHDPLIIRVVVGIKKRRKGYMLMAEGAAEQLKGLTTDCLITNCVGSSCWCLWYDCLELRSWRCLI